MKQWKTQVDRYLARWARTYAGHELRQISRGVDKQRWSTWVLRRPDSMVMSTTIVCAGNQVILCGDAHPGGGRSLGSIPLSGRPLQWFGEKHGHDYLAGKFLDRRCYAPYVVDWLNDSIVSELEVRGECEEVSRLRALRDAVHRVGGAWSHPLEEQLHEADVPELMERLHEATGHDRVPDCYNPNDYAWLAVIQRRFHELYAEVPPGGPGDDEWGRAREAAGVPPFDPAGVIGWLQRAGERIDTEFTARPGYRDSEGTAPTACELQDAEWTLRGLFGVWNEPEEDPCD